MKSSDIAEAYNNLIRRTHNLLPSAKGIESLKCAHGSIATTGAPYGIDIVSGKSLDKVGSTLIVRGGEDARAWAINVRHDLHLITSRAQRTHATRKIFMGKGTRRRDNGNMPSCGQETLRHKCERGGIFIRKGKVPEIMI